MYHSVSQCCIKVSTHGDHKVTVETSRTMVSLRRFVTFRCQLFHAEQVIPPTLRYLQCHRNKKMIGTKCRSSENFSANRSVCWTYLCPRPPIAPTNRIDVAVSALLWSYKGEYGYDVLHQFGDDGKARERAYVCANCGKGYAVKRSLWRHRKFECINPATKFTCDVCSYESPYKWRVDNHSKKHDNNHHSQYFDS